MTSKELNKFRWSSKRLEDAYHSISSQPKVTIFNYYRGVLIKSPATLTRKTKITHENNFSDMEFEVDIEDNKLACVTFFEKTAKLKHSSLGDKKYLEGKIKLLKESPDTPRLTLNKFFEVTDMRTEERFLPVEPLIAHLTADNGKDISGRVNNVSLSGIRISFSLGNLCDVIKKHKCYPLRIEDKHAKFYFNSSAEAKSITTISSESGSSVETRCSFDFSNYGLFSKPYITKIRDTIISELEEFSFRQ